MEKLLTLLINYGMANLAAQQCLKFMALNVDKHKCYLNANSLENVLSQVKYLFDLNWLPTPRKKSVRNVQKSRPNVVKKCVSPFVDSS